MFDELYHIAKTTGGELCLFNGVPSKLSEWVGDEWYEMHKARMAEVDNDFCYKIIVKEGEVDLAAVDYAQYKFFPENLFHNKTIYILGNIVFFRDEEHKELRLIRLEQTELSKTMRVLFDIAWENVAKDF